MKINSVSQVSHRANVNNNLKKLSIPLKDDSKALISLSDNYFECLVAKDNKIISGYGHKAKDGVKAEDISKVYNSLKDSIKEGVDFLDEFIKVVFS